MYKFIMKAGGHWDGDKLRKEGDVFDSELPLHELFPDKIGKFGGAVEDDDPVVTLDDTKIQERWNKEAEEDRIIGRYRLKKVKFGRFEVYDKETGERIGKKALNEKNVMELIEGLEAERKGE